MKHAVTTALALLFLSCDSSPTEPNSPVTFREVAVVQNSGILSRRHETITTAKRWTEVWTEVHARQSPEPSLPAVEFDRESVLLTAMGENPDACWSVRVHALERFLGTLIADVKEVRAPMSCACPPVVVAPVHMVAISRTNDPIRFVSRTAIEGEECH